MSQPVPTQSAQAIRAWILSQVAAELDIDPAEIDVHEPLTRFGMDSMTAVVLTGELEHWLGRAAPPDLLEKFGTIDALARHLAAAEAPAAAATAQSETASEPEEPPPDWQVVQPTRFQRLMRRLTVRLLKRLVRIEVEGFANVPTSGAFLLACNHLHILDTPVVFSVVPGLSVFFISDHMLKFPLLGWYVRQLGRGIYVARGKGDRQALNSALAALGAGERVAIAPEGRISRTGGLLQGQTGAAYLAARSGVPVLPVVVFGQEKISAGWRRLRRAAVSVRVGTPLRFPARRAGTREIEDYTRQIMLTLARMLPPQYRGYYTTTEAGHATPVPERRTPLGASEGRG